MIVHQMNNLTFNNSNIFFMILTLWFVFHFILLSVGFKNIYIYNKQL